MVALFSVLATIASEVERAPRAREEERRGRKDKTRRRFFFVCGDDGYGGWGWGSAGPGEGAKVLGVWKVKGRRTSVQEHSPSLQCVREKPLHTN